MASNVSLGAECSAFTLQGRRRDYSADRTDRAVVAEGVQYASSIEAIGLDIDKLTGPKTASA